MSHTSAFCIHFVLKSQSTEMGSSNNIIFSSRNIFDVSPSHFQPETIIEDVSSLTLCMILWARHFSSKEDSKPFALSYDPNMSACSMGEAWNIYDEMESGQVPLKMFIHLGKMSCFLYVPPLDQIKSEPNVVKEATTTIWYVLSLWCKEQNKFCKPIVTKTGIKTYIEKNIHF